MCVLRSRSVRAVANASRRTLDETARAATTATYSRPRAPHSRTRRARVRSSGARVRRCEMARARDVRARALRRACVALVLTLEVVAARIISRAPDDDATLASPRGDVRALTHATLRDVVNARIVPGDGESGTETAPEAIAVEFYAPWCPHCQRFAPKYAEAAGIVKSRVISYAVDCDAEGAMCQAFGAKGFPTLLMGDAEAFASKDATRLNRFKGPHTTEGVVRFVDEVLRTTFSARFGEKRPESDGERRSAGALAKEFVMRDGSKIKFSNFAHVADLERATVEMYAQMTSEAVFVSTPEARKAFSNFLALVSAAHPLETCYRALTNLYNSLDERWPEDAEKTTGDIRASLSLGVRVCGNARGNDVTIVPRWTDCAGSVEGLRGYTCGVWMLLHALAVRAPTSGISNERFIEAIEGWVREFFPCAECRKHFLSLIEDPETGFKAYVDRADGASMWLWKAHNLVNERLALEDAQEETASAQVRTGNVLAKGDPAHPKIQFPPKSLCPSCLAPTGGGEDDWDEMHVSQFLLAYYLGDGPRRDLDLKAPTKKASFLLPTVDASSDREEAKLLLRRSLNSGADVINVYEIFWMSARFFFMFAFILFMAVKAGVLSLYHERFRPRTRSPRTPPKTASYDKLA